MTELTAHEEFLAQLDQLLKEEGGGGGIIGRAKYEMGYKAFLAGYANEDSWFPFSMNAPGERAEALTKCKVVINESGVEGRRPQLSFGFILFKDSVKGREVTWQQDRYFITPTWTPAAQEVIYPAIADRGILPGEFWGRWAWTEDPSGRMETDQDGNERVALVAYPAEVYGSEAEAEAAAGGDASDGEAEQWLIDFVADIKADANLPVPALKAKYEVDDVMAANLKSDDEVVLAGAIAGMTGQSIMMIGGLL